MTAVVSLVAAAIGASAAISAQLIQSRAARRSGVERERQQAVEEVLVRAGAIDLCVNDMTVLAANAGSFNGTLARVLRIVVPLDYADMLARLSGEATSLNRAATQVWMSGDAQAVKLVNAVTLAATTVVEAHTKPRTNWLLNFARIVILGRTSRDDERIDLARKTLAKARRELVEHHRRQLNLDEVDLFALPSGDARPTQL